MKQFLMLLFMSALAGTGWSDSSSAVGRPAPKLHEPIKPIPLATNLDTRKVALGRMLFHESKLSHDNSVSCARCHDLRKGGTDQRVRSLGIKGAEGTINAPTVFNSAGNFKQFWDGRAATLEEQIDGPILAPHEMGSTWPEVVGKLRAAPEYTASFAAIYPDGIQPKNIKDAIAEFERSLVTPNARFDKYLCGDDTALTQDEKEGYRKFKSFGCTSCHQGVNVGGNMFETLGAMADYFADRGGAAKVDNGRFNVTGRDEDRYVFKVPGLRNVARTAPYLHDGSAETLEKAVTIMGRYQLGETLSSEDVQQIAKFLRTLTGEYEGRPL
jgi:cytochrome c peroxidase